MQQQSQQCKRVSRQTQYNRRLMYAADGPHMKRLDLLVPPHVYEHFREVVSELGAYQRDALIECIERTHASVVAA